MENKLPKTLSLAWHKGPGFIQCLVHSKHSIVYHIHLSDWTQTLELVNLLSILRKDWIGAKLVMGRWFQSFSHLTKCGRPHWGTGWDCPVHINCPSLGTALYTRVSPSDHVCATGPHPGWDRDTALSPVHPEISCSALPLSCVMAWWPSDHSMLLHCFAFGGVGN